MIALIVVPKRVAIAYRLSPDCTTYVMYGGFVAVGGGTCVNVGGTGVAVGGTGVVVGGGGVAVAAGGAGVAVDVLVGVAVDVGVAVSTGSRVGVRVSVGVIATAADTPVGVGPVPAVLAPVPDPDWPPNNSEPKSMATTANPRRMTTAPTTTSSHGLRRAG